MRTQVSFSLIDVTQDTEVPALLIEEVSEEELREVDSVWGPLLGTLELEHSHWHWERKLRQPEPTLCCYGIHCLDRMQGLMIVKAKKARLVSQLDVPLLYIDYVATAPWNMRHPITREWELIDWEGARFPGCGPVLFRRAIAHSRDAGYEGRIGLHSLPQAERFYARLGMTDLGFGIEPYPTLRYYEMTPEQAQAFLGV